jgi:hypothetical protein
VLAACPHPEQVITPPVEAPKPAPAVETSFTGASSEVPIPALTAGQAASSAASSAPAAATAAAASATDANLTTREPPVACEGGPTSPVHAPATVRGEPPVHIKVEVFLADKAQRDQQVQVEVGVALVRHGVSCCPMCVVRESSVDRCTTTTLPFLGSSLFQKAGTTAHAGTGDTHDGSDTVVRQRVMEACASLGLCSRTARWRVDEHRVWQPQAPKRSMRERPRVRIGLAGCPHCKHGVL